DVQDASALIARSNFYAQYLAGYQGPINQAAGNTPLTGFGGMAWNGLGSEPPIEGALTTALSLDIADTRAGFNTAVILKAEETGRDKSAIQWESSNFIWETVHGFWYHFVPDAVNAGPAVPVVNVGVPLNGPTGPYAVKHVKYMSMGPSVMALESCITARTDGLKAYNTISQAFLHAGVNAYMGGTRSMWGSITPAMDTPTPLSDKLGEYVEKNFFGHLTGYYTSDADPTGTVTGMVGDMDVGHALLYARNAYASATGLTASDAIDTMSVIVIYADPAFNPYEPNHEGGLPSV
ncbi:MAG: C25 family cysteine peptidase, partial [Candidatus Thermoplasmatota archaeon]|nr:C25 family cysteine peptidase [Candidatus Thermoplasmatota archaeon]